MAEFIDIPSFSDYKMNKYGKIIRKNDNYEPYVTLNFKAKLYDSGFQKDFDVLNGIQQLFPEEYTSIYFTDTTGLAQPTTQGQPQRETPQPDISAILYTRILGLRIHKHFKAYIFRQLGLNRVRIGNLLYNGNYGAARNAEILYSENSQIINKSALSLRRQLGLTDYQSLRNAIGGVILPNI